MGPLDILVNNAGMYPMAPTAQIDEATFDAVIACAGVGGPMYTPEAIVRVNYFGAVATLEDLRPFLRRGHAPREQ